MTERRFARLLLAVAALTAIAAVSAHSQPLAGFALTGVLVAGVLWVDPYGREEE